MTDRCHLYRPITDDAGNLVSDLEVRVLQPGTTSEITHTIYASDVGSTTIDQPFVASDGVVDIYLNTPQRVRLGLTPPGQTEFFLEDVDVLPPAELIVWATAPMKISNSPTTNQVLTGATSTSSAWADNAGGSGGGGDGSISWDVLTAIFTPSADDSGVGVLTDATSYRNTVFDTSADPVVTMLAGGSGVGLVTAQVGFTGPALEDNKEYWVLLELAISGGTSSGSCQYNGPCVTGPSSNHGGSLTVSMLMPAAQWTLGDTLTVAATMIVTDPVTSLPVALDSDGTMVFEITLIDLSSVGGGGGGGGALAGPITGEFIKIPTDSDGGGSPNGIAASPDGSTLYVANYSASSVTPIDVATNTPGAPISVDTGPFALAVSPDGSTLCVGSSFHGTVTFVDLATNIAGTPILLAGDGSSSTEGIVFTPDGTTVYVSDDNSGSGVVWPVDVATGTVGSPITVSDGAYGLAITPDGASLYVACNLDRSVDLIDVATNTVTTSGVINLGGTSSGTPTGIVITSDGATLYAAYQDSLYPMDVATNTPGSPIPLPGGTYAYAIALTPDDATIYYVDDNTSAFSFDVATNTPGTVPIPCGSEPITVTVTSDGKVFVVNNGDNTVSQLIRLAYFPL